MSMDLDIAKVRHCNECIHRRVCAIRPAGRYFVVGCREFLEEVVCWAEAKLGWLQLSQLAGDREMAARVLEDRALRELAKGITTSEAVRVKRSCPGGGLGITATCHLVVYEKEPPSMGPDRIEEWGEGKAYEVFGVDLAEEGEDQTV